MVAEHRGNGYATRAVELLLRRLARDTQYTAATLPVPIDPASDASLAVAGRCSFNRRDDVRGQRYFSRLISR